MLRVAVLCSKRAPGLVDLLADDDARGRLYEIVCCVTSEQTFEEAALVEQCGVPILAHPIRAYYRRRGAPLYRDKETRERYDARTVRLLRVYAPDIVLLDGYLYLVTSPLLTAFAGRMINLHFSDLTLRLPDGRPRYPGLRAVRDTIAAGQSGSRATVHLVNVEPDGGAPIVRSWSLPVSPLVHDAIASNAQEMLRAYVHAHQQWMMSRLSGPVLSAALILTATGQLDLAQLAASRPRDVVPWDVDEDGSLQPPERERITA